MKKISTLQSEPILQVLQRCVSSSDKLCLKPQNNETPIHWETKEGDILWLNANVLESTNYLTCKVRHATKNEMLNDPVIRNGAEALVHLIENYQNKIHIKQRDAVKLESEFERWAPSVNTHFQDAELKFALDIELFFGAQNDLDSTPSETMWNKVKHFFLCPRVGIKNREVVLVNTYLFMPSFHVRQFIKAFNHMMERRTYLLNNMLRLYSYPEVISIPLTFKADSTIEHVRRKHNMLCLLEKQCLNSIIDHKIKHFLNIPAISDETIIKLLNELAEIVCLWNTLWLDKKEMIREQVLMHIYVLHSHPSMDNNMALFQRFQTKIDETLFS